jgi:putative DNA-invertase from lambdoid prophage Rac
MRVAIYARVSTTDQNCEMQLRELRDYCGRRGWEIAGEYVDTGWSGAKKSRPQLDRLMADARAHRVVAVWKLDRFGRSVSHLVESVQALRSAGVRFLCTSQGLDTDESNPASQLLFHILAAVAEFERGMIRERVKAGVQAARHQGRCGGRPKVIFSRDRARELREAGLSCAAIAQRLGVGYGTVQRLLAVQKPS